MKTVYALILAILAFSAYGQTGNDAAQAPELSPGGEQPPALALRVIQTRIFETNLKDLTDAYKEMCKNGGGIISSIEYCGHAKLKAFKKFYSQAAHIEGEVETVDATHVKLRIRIKDVTGTPAFNKFVYSAVFKDISDSLGILGVPINVKIAE